MVMKMYIIAYQKKSEIIINLSLAIKKIFGSKYTIYQ